VESELANLSFVEVHDGDDVCGRVSPFSVVAYHSFAFVAAARYDAVLVVGIVVPDEHAGSGF